MANSLDRDLRNGDKVIVEGRTFVCDGGGFGSYSLGTALFGRFEGHKPQD